MTVKGRRLAICALLGAAAALVPLVAAAPSHPLTPLNVGIISASLGQLPVYIAIEDGYFAEQGLEVRFRDLREVAQTWPPLINGQLDLAMTTYTAGFIQAVLQGAKMRIVADSSHGGPGYRSPALMVRQDLIDSGRYRTFKDLRGMRISVGARASLAEQFLLKVLRNRALLTQHDVEVVQVPRLLIPDALRARTLDATTAPEPLVTRLESLGLARTIAVVHDVLPGAQLSAVIYGPSILSRNPGLGQRFMLAYLRGVQQYRQGKTDRNIAIAQKYLGDDEDLLRRMSWSLIHADGHLNVENIMETQAWWLREGWIERIAPPEQIIDPTYARRAFRTLTAGR